MQIESPLTHLHERHLQQLAARPASLKGANRPGAAKGFPVHAAELELLPYGERSASGEPVCAVIASFGEVEPEYAAIRRAAGLLDCPHRATLRVTGADRTEFLNRMLTAELKDLQTGVVKHAFWLNRKGRIEADLMLVELGDHLLIDVDVHQAATTAASLTDFLFAEDVQIRDDTGAMWRVSVHGPKAIAVVASASDDPDFTLGEHGAAQVALAGHEVVVARADQTGEPGLHLFMQRDHAARTWEALMAADASIGGGKRRVRPIGWFAFNIARVEAGTPLFNIDFGSSNLPHESGLLEQRVSFTKGCYVGQEVVARMQHLGRPKQILRGLRIEAESLPVAGTQVFALESGQSPADPVGLVTSSTLSPMLGAKPVAFAMLRRTHAAEDTRVCVIAEGEEVPAVVQGLRFLHPAEASSRAGADSPSREN